MEDTGSSETNFRSEGGRQWLECVVSVPIHRIASDGLLARLLLNCSNTCCFTHNMLLSFVCAVSGRVCFWLKRGFDVEYQFLVCPREDKCER